MITASQLGDLVKSKKIGESVVFREYLQLLFLQKIYSFNLSEKVFFKGGTAIHLIYGAPRYSEDLDFTVELTKYELDKLLPKVFSGLENEYAMKFIDRKSLAGKRYTMSCRSVDGRYDMFVNLDFSFRESILERVTSRIETDFPLVFDNYVHHLSDGEMLAEKIRAITSREKGRDLYDIWYLMARGTKIDEVLMAKKLAYFNEKLDWDKIKGRVEKFDKKKFVLDLRPFVTIGERDKLDKLFDYVQDYLKDKL